MVRWRLTFFFLTIVNILIFFFDRLDLLVLAGLDLLGPVDLPDFHLRHEKLLLLGSLGLPGVDERVLVHHHATDEKISTCL